MVFMPKSATSFQSIADLQQVVRAYKKLGKPVVMIPVWSGLHAGDVQRMRLARRIPGALTVATLIDAPPADRVLLATEKIDCVLELTEEELFPNGRRTTIAAGGVTPSLGMQLGSLLALLNIVQPNDLFISEKDYEFLISAQHMITDFHMGIRVLGVPVVREPDGLACDLKNQDLTAEGRESALAISAALVAGAHAAEGGAVAVLDAAHSVLREVPLLKVESIQLCSAHLGDAPEVGEARLFIKATIDGITLSDNAAVPLGVGFRGQDIHVAE
ncbi:pantoate--beta-alanine ligase [Corynebacterium freiburgense]|uniref:pantoate--beta-alanine ligase n=1 Tax=Corynebacterium freiburgense TaxID=556548 RepID=UPI0004184073|nr:pantoate--beta-alanine ligase [Corynebacterium freiburgense]WJZ03683.1 Pantothenate synthetase [Corynebacterium freiburgense]